jgi:hypothetical protein
MKKLFLFCVILMLFRANVSSQSCLPEGITFTTQAQIDSFYVNYPGCEEIEGSLGIGSNEGGTNITNLYGLGGLYSIGGDLSILNNNWSFIRVTDNHSLTSLTGLNNIDPASIQALWIEWNPNLPECDVYSICQYLSGPVGEVSIQENADGCNSAAQILVDCSDDCLPDGITFETQAQIDSYQVDHPGCAEIEGDVVIGAYYNDIDNLNGLSSVTRIGGDLLFYRTSGLQNLSGLDNLNSVGGDMTINENFALADLTGLNNLAYIGKNLYIENNNDLVDITGLDSLSDVGHDLWITNNFHLPALTGLERLTSIHGSLRLGNEHLVDLTALENLTSVGDLIIWGNNSLKNLSGLDHLISIEGYLQICYDDSLVNLSNLNNLESIGTTLMIQGNNSLTSLHGLEGLTSIPDYLQIENCDALSSLSGLDGLTSIGNLDVLYCDGLVSFEGLQNVTSIEGGLVIDYNNILESLTGLDNVTSIGYIVNIEENNSLASLTGLHNVTAIGDYLYINNNFKLPSLTGLEHLKFIGGALNMWGNTSLKSIAALDSLEFVGGFLGIAHNDSLTSLTGLDDMNSDSVEYLVIIYNASLPECAVKSICDYLAVPNGSIEIHDNAHGCNSQEEVEAACLQEVEEVSSQQSAVSSYPNPVTDHVTFKIRLEDPAKVNVTVFNCLGQVVATMPDQSLEKGDHLVTWNAENLSPGIYFYRLSTVNCQLSTNGKLVVAKK